MEEGKKRFHQTDNIGEAKYVTCNKCETVGYVNFDKGVDDAYCSYCGNWQKSREHSSLEEKK